MKKLFTYALALGTLLLTGHQLAAQIEKAPARKAAEGDGPHNRLIIRGVTLINSCLLYTSPSPRD